MPKKSGARRDVLRWASGRGYVDLGTVSKRKLDDETWDALLQEICDMLGTTEWVAVVDSRLP